LLIERVFLLFLSRVDVLCSWSITKCLLVYSARLSCISCHQTPFDAVFYSKPFVITVATSESDCRVTVQRNMLFLTSLCEANNNESSQLIYVVAKLLSILFFTDCWNSKRIAQQTPHVVIEGTVMRLHALEKPSYPSFTFSNEQNSFG